MSAKVDLAKEARVEISAATWKPNLHRARRAVESQGGTGQAWSQSTPVDNVSPVQMATALSETNV